MLEKSQFSRRLTRLADLINIVFHQFGETIKELNLESRYCLDSFPVSICDNIRIYRSRLTDKFSEKEQFRGYIASKRRYFYGIRVQVTATISGIPVEYV